MVTQSHIGKTIESAKFSAGGVPASGFWFAPRIGRKARMHLHRLCFLPSFRSVR